jgi:hypothetical protein
MGHPAQSFQRWIDIIKEAVMTELVPALSACGMSISEAEFKAATPGDTPYNLINIADFNSLIAQSQKYSTPVFALSDAQIEQVGEVLKTMKMNRNDFRRSFNSLAGAVQILAHIP